MIDLYDRNVDAFAAARSTSLFESGWLSAFRRTMPAGGASVLDLGCGTGRPLAAHLIDAGCRLTGIDGAPGMIDRARTAFPDHDWRVADMRALPPLGRFDGLIAWHSLFHLTPEDQRSIIAAMSGLASPGAALMFTSGPAFGVSLGTFAGSPLYHASLAPAAYRGALRDAGFEVRRHVACDPTCGGATVWLARRTC
ncbi:Mg-protoporphyrin IX methyl transferase [Roseivivax jejudonensis]|uniref:Mg-protoporphyrin IX methyl transferase n=1 Tax=Roseivivax jejudonensis TaxID=1529041 RepID=A0A1X6YTT7_9RHOB|nr:Mg-protoporphyrin IX methyl transferase [Roseivivax jejudonensis]